MKQVELNKFCYDYAKTLEQWVTDYFYSDFTMSVKLDWSKNRKNSRGGLYADGPGINMAMNSIYPDNKGYVYRFYEYPSYNSHPVIGGFYSKDPIHKVKALLLHETAHAAQFFSYKKNNTRCKPHGTVFKDFYKQLRVEFLNYQLPDQIKYKQDYETYINKITRTNVSKLNEFTFANS
jgi:hypothetical protein